MPLFSGLLVAGLGIAGDVMASDSASAANDANLQISRENAGYAMERQTQQEGFNRQEAAVARDFSAQQVQQQEQFQRESQGEAERYNTEMSNTAMQRRVADLRAAGINPLLAVSQGGASTPTVSGMSGNAASASQASGGIAGAPGPIPMQNAGAPYGNLGGIINSALMASQTGAQIDLLKAQTNKLNAESGSEIPAQVGYLKSMTGLTDQNANQAYYNTQLIQEKIYGQRLDNDQIRDVLTPLNGQKLEVLKATRDALISATQSDATAKQLQLAGLRNLNEIQDSNLGRILAYLNALLQPIGTAAKAAGSF